MPKIRKQKRNKTFRYNVNRRKLRDRKREQPKIRCEAVKKAWDSKKSIRNNMTMMGLAFDPNIAIPIPSTKDMLRPKPMDLEEHTASGVFRNDTEVVAQLEKIAATRKNIKRKFPPLTKEQLEYLLPLFRTHGNNFKTMSMDPKNYYQETQGQLQKKFRQFKQMKEFEEFKAERDMPSASADSKKMECE